MALETQGGETEAADYSNPQAVLYQHYQLDQRARGVTLGIGRRSVPSAESGFSTPRNLQTEQFGETKPTFSQAQTPPTVVD